VDRAEQSVFTKLVCQIGYVGQIGYAKLAIAFIHLFIQPVYPPVYPP
jgi:hypothetical protein